MRNSVRALELLVIANDTPARARLELLLQEAGVNVYATSQALFARRAMEDLPFRYILIDSELKDADARELAADFRSGYSNPRPFIVWRARQDSPTDRQQGRLAGADAFLCVHSDANELLALLAPFRE